MAITEPMLRPCASERRTPARSAFCSSREYLGAQRMDDKTKLGCSIAKRLNWAAEQLFAILVARDIFFLFSGFLLHTLPFILMPFIASFPTSSFSSYSPSPTASRESLQSPLQLLGLRAKGHDSAHQRKHLVSHRSRGRIEGLALPCSIRHDHAKRRP